jgi:hypothetical protein
VIPELRQRFNRDFRPEKYEQFLAGLDQAAGTHVGFRNSETPVFFEEELLNRMAVAGRELLDQLLGNPTYKAASDRIIPDEFRVPDEVPHPLFVQADFGIVHDTKGNYQPRLVEIQGFPSLYGFQRILAEQYRRTYGLDPSLHANLGRLSSSAYDKLLRRAIVGNHASENVVLLEIDPRNQKTLCDFIATERLLGVRAVCITQVVKQGRRLYYPRDGCLVPIERIYNRAIADELIRREIKVPFDFRDDLQVEWAGHPNWFFRLSKYSIPYFNHPTVPRTWFLDEVTELPLPPENLVLKPLFSFAGLGVVVGPTADQLAEVPLDRRHDYILQERVDFTPVIDTPYGPTKAEVRIMYLWLDELTPVNTIIRTGRGKMMGVDHNKGMDWVGASAAFYPEA